jgi:RNA polymerase sigma-70 factor (ECF subfamily)
MDDDQQPIEVAAPAVGRHDGALSFEGFFRREYRQVLGLAFVLSGSRWVAEELTMEAFEAAMADWPRVSQLDSPGAWVRKVVSNASASRFRRQAAERRAKARMTGDARLWQLDGLGDPGVWESVRDLPRRQAQVVALFYEDGYQPREIAQVLGISEESVKTHLERGRSRLREVLGDDDEG